MELIGLDVLCFVEKPNESGKGCFQLKNYCEEKLLSYFDNNAITWERQGHQLPFPLHVKLRLQFTAFNGDLAIKDRGVDFRKIAFLHFYFLRPLTVEEYRSNCRHDVSEWFSTVNQNDGVEWIVVFDSTKAREKRNRGAVMERIKNDFARFTNRIIEISENAPNSIVSLQTLAKVHLLASLDRYISAEEGRLADLKEDYYKLDFDYIAFSKAQMQIARLYYSLNVIERVLAKLDELDALISLIIGYVISQDSQPQWLSKGSDAVSEACPLLSVMAYQEEVQGLPFLIDVRTFIVAQKMTASLLLYQERVKHMLQNGLSSTTQIKSDFAAIVLRHANHCLVTVFENLASLKLSVDADRLQCWTLSFCLETLQLVSMVIENLFVKNLSFFICSITVSKCKAAVSLYHSYRKGCFKNVINWQYEAVHLHEAAKHSEAVVQLKNASLDDEHFANFVRNTFENSLVLLKHFEWERQRSLLGYEFGNLFLDFGLPEIALPHLLRVVRLFIHDGSPLLVEVLPAVIEQLEKLPNSYHEELLRYYFIMSFRALTAEERASYCKKLFDSLNIGKVDSLMWTSQSRERLMPLQLSLPPAISRIVATPGEVIKIEMRVLNNFPLRIPRCSISCVFERILNTASIEHCKHKPQFLCSYSLPDSVARFGCVKNGVIASDKSTKEKEENAVTVADVVKKELLLFDLPENKSQPLNCGGTTLELQATALNTGVFTLSRVEVTAMDSLTFLLLWSDVLEIDANPSMRPVCFIHNKIPTVRLQVPDEPLYAGVVQLLNLELFNGSEINGEDAVDIETFNKEKNFEFWDPTQSDWRSNCKLFVEKTSAGSPIKVPFYVCCFLRQLTQFPPDEDAVAYSKELTVKWRGLQWQFPVSFIPLIRIRTTTSLLEDKLLFELQFLRPNSGLWVMRPQETLLSSCNSDMTKPAKLINPKLTDILPSSTYRIVWLLDRDSNMKNDVEEFHLDFKYRVRLVEEANVSVPEAMYDRPYNYEDTFAIANEKASYELFAQILSAQPGAVLCRVNSPCDLIVSLRSLSNRVETVVISIEADEEYWAINDRHKFLYVKESGLGQTSFSIVPKMVGFLPYPSISVFRCQHQRRSSDKSVSSRCEQSDFGSRVPSYVRSAGKQIHVLGLHHSGSEQRFAGEKTKRLKDAKNRLAKLFD